MIPKHVTFRKETIGGEPSVAFTILQGRSVTVGHVTCEDIRKQIGAGKLKYPISKCDHAELKAMIYEDYEGE